jgi:hypothetical protein
LARRKAPAINARSSLTKNRNRKAIVMTAPVYGGHHKA